MNSVGQRLQFAAAPSSVDRAWLWLSCLGCSSGRAKGGAEGGAGTRLECVFEPLSPVLLQTEEPQGTKMKFRDCLFLWKQGFYSQHGKQFWSYPTKWKRKQVFRRSQGK